MATSYEINPYSDEIAMPGRPDDKITRLIAVPSWMVYGAIALICVLSGGPLAQIVVLTNQIYEVQDEMSGTRDRIASTDREVASMKVKQDDIVHALKDVHLDLQELNKNVTVLSAKMP